MEQAVQFAGLTLRLLDTAGIRDTDDEIERMGWTGLYRRRDEAQLALFVRDGSARWTRRTAGLCEAPMPVPTPSRFLIKRTCPRC